MDFTPFFRRGAVPTTLCECFVAKTLGFILCLEKKEVDLRCITKRDSTRHFF